ncbi:hypothetical protein U5640_41625 [Streptomyces sp. SS7]|uniref:hypothetical protein n=1 Tax=Streptomyces sp. SS7 TaxID=3108485 RepID=UPI0030EECE80
MSRLDALTAGPRPDLVLDLRPVSFIDCAGLGVLWFLRILRCTGLAGAFGIHPRRPADLIGTPVARSVSASAG